MMYWKFLNLIGWPRMGKKVFVTSDLHLSNQNIREYCPGRKEFSNNVEEMDAALVKNWNQTVRKNDIVHVLGDFCMGKMDTSLALVSQLNGEIVLYTGNHDRPTVIYYDHREKGILEMISGDLEKWAKTEKKIQDWEKKYLDVGITKIYDLGLEPSIEMNMGPFNIMMSHFPYTGDHMEKERYTAYRPFDRGHLLLHGHVHDLWKFNGRMINTGMDVWNYRPVELRRAILDWWSQASKEDRARVRNR